MKDRSVLNERIRRIVDEANYLTIKNHVNDYLEGDINNMQMFNRILDALDGDRKQTDTIAWEVNDWENEEAENETVSEAANTKPIVCHRYHAQEGVPLEQGKPAFDLAMELATIRLAAASIAYKYDERKRALCLSAEAKAVLETAGFFTGRRISIVWKDVECSEFQLVEDQYAKNQKVIFDSEVPVLGIYKYRFDYKVDPKNPDYKEYNGFTFTAPDEQTAWNDFLLSTGEFGCPVSKDYNIINTGLAYEFTGTVEQWKQAVKDGEVE